jgi:hypothetical protein
MVERVLIDLFPNMRDVVGRVKVLTQTQVDHITRLFRSTDTATTYVAQDVVNAYDDILKWRVH